MINLQINLTTIALPNILYGSGLFMALTPLIPLSCSTTKNENMTNATGLQNLLKNIGGAIGTSIATTMVARYAQAHQHMMTNHLHETNNILRNVLPHLQEVSHKLQTLQQLTLWHRGKFISSWSSRLTYGHILIRSDGLLLQHSC